MEFVDRCYLIGLIVIVNVTYNLKEPSYSSDKKSNAKKSKISSLDVYTKIQLIRQGPIS